ncbi:TAR DNA-binding protein 43-like isoform X2 [Amphiura filiformis]|uniref:TAR DNA-binding protein 43-like isoform X2 n=1 Tax=Amphiura filiformis TaxID=82378 RepID=UPI003B2226F4
MPLCTTKVPKMCEYVRIVEEEADDEPIELPSEEDGTMLLSTLTAQFPGASGLKYRNPDTGTLRGLRVFDGRIQAPDGHWGDTLYIAVFPKGEKGEEKNKRKGEEHQENTAAKNRRVERKCTDLIVLGLPWKTTEPAMRTYFEQFGELLMCQVKKDSDGNSKGFGFVRYKDYDVQMKVVAQRHMIDGRWCDVKIPDSRVGRNEADAKKMFIGRITADMTDEDLYTYFSTYGEVTDVYFPKPCRGFAFVTFSNAEAAQKLALEDHIIKGTSVYVSNAEPKNPRQGPGMRGVADGNPLNTMFAQFGQGFAGQGQGGRYKDYRVYPQEYDDFGPR